MMKNISRISLLAAVVLLFNGCSSLVMGPPTQSVENIQRLREANLTPVALGDFLLDAKASPSMDKQISVRGANSIQAPTNGSFAQYLKETLAVELKAAGLLDPSARAIITGTLLDTQLDPAIVTGKASLSARFVVTQEGQERYRRDLSVNSQWESSFMAAIAVPLAAGQYQALYRKLVSTLIQDPDFKQALKKK